MALIVIELESAMLTVSPALTEPLTLPLVPVTVTVYDPAGVLVAVLTVIVEVAVLPDARVTDTGENEVVAPLGSPLALRATEPVKPPVEVTEMV
jgi:hypothetical protein